MLGVRCRLGVGRRESGGNISPRARLDWAPRDRIAAGQGLSGRDRIRTCVGNAGDFTGRIAVSPRVPAHPLLIPNIARDVHEWPVDSFGRHLASPPVSPRPARPSVGRREVRGKFLTTIRPRFRTHTAGNVGFESMGRLDRVVYQGSPRRLRYRAASTRVTYDAQTGLELRSVGMTPDNAT